MSDRLFEVSHSLQQVRELLTLAPGFIFCSESGVHLVCILYDNQYHIRETNRGIGWGINDRWLPFGTDALFMKFNNAEEAYEYWQQNKMQMLDFRGF